MTTNFDVKNVNASKDVIDFLEQITDFAKDVEVIPVPWGRILKGEGIDELFVTEIEQLESLFHMEGISHSVAIGVMEKGAFHEPYLRVVDGIDNARRVYKVLEGSFTCYRDDELRTYNSQSSFAVVGNMDLFSFTAGEEGCVFAIFNFPAFGSSEAVDYNRIVVPAER